MRKCGQMLAQSRTGSNLTEVGVVEKALVGQGSEPPCPPLSGSVAEVDALWVKADAVGEVKAPLRVNRD